MKKPTRRERGTRKLIAVLGRCMAIDEREVVSPQRTSRDIRHALAADDFLQL